MTSLIRRFTLLAGALLGICLPLIMPLPASANILSDACQSAPSSATCKSTSPNTNPLTGTDGTLYKVSMIVASVAAVAAVIVIILSGFRYITSGGDTQKTAAAKNTLIGAIVGLVIIALAQAIIILVIKSIG